MSAMSVKYAIVMGRARDALLTPGREKRRFMKRSAVSRIRGGGGAVRCNSRASPPHETQRFPEQRSTVSAEGGG